MESLKPIRDRWTRDLMRFLVNPDRKPKDQWEIMPWNLPRKGRVSLDE